VKNRNLVVIVGTGVVLIALLLGYLIGENQSLKNQRLDTSIESFNSETDSDVVLENTEDQNDSQEISASTKLDAEFLLDLANSSVDSDSTINRDATKDADLEVQSCVYYQYVPKGQVVNKDFGKAEECGENQYIFEYCASTPKLEITTFTSIDNKQFDGPTIYANLDNTWNEKLSEEAECDSTIWNQYGFDVEPPYYSFSTVVQDSRNESIPSRKFLISDDGCCGLDVYMIETKLQKKESIKPQSTQQSTPKPSASVTTDKSESSNKKNILARMCSNYYQARNAWYEANRNTFTGGSGIEAASQQKLQDATERLANVIDPKAGPAYIDMKDFVFHLRQIYKAYYPNYDYWTLDGNGPKLVYFSEKIDKDYC